MSIPLSIMVVSYNTRELTLACLESVVAQTSGLEYELIVVDNASGDKSADAITARFPQVRMIALSENLGFAGGNNLAAREARGEWLLLLNPDTLILDGAIQKVIAFAHTHPQAGIFGGRTVFADGSLNYGSCHGRPTPWSLLCMGIGLSSMFRQSRWLDPESLGAWKRDTPREVDAVTGCFLLIRKEFWNRLGGFDEAYFMYGEETDLCLRAWKSGSRCMICPDAHLVHYGGASETVRADKMVRLFEAKARLLRSHWKPGSVWFGLCMLDLWALSRMLAFKVLSSIRGKYRKSYETWRSIWQRRGEWRPLPAAADSAAG